MASQEVRIPSIKPFLILMGVVCTATIATVVYVSVAPKTAPTTVPAPNTTGSLPSNVPAVEPAPKSEGLAATPATAAAATDTKPIEYRPAGTGQPTLIVIETGGGSAAAVQRVEFFVEAPFKTPSRGAGKISPGAIAVAFEQRSYDAKAGKFAINLQAPQIALVSHQAAPLAISIVWPKFAGWTYRGKLKVIPAGQQPIEVKNVEVDIVKAPVK